MPIAEGGTPIREELHDLVNALLVGREIIPEHGGVLEVGLGIPLLCVDKQGEVRRIPDEKHGGVVSHATIMVSCYVESVVRR